MIFSLTSQVVGLKLPKFNIYRCRHSNYVWKEIHFPSFIMSFGISAESLAESSDCMNVVADWTLNPLPRNILTPRIWNLLKLWRLFSRFWRWESLLNRNANSKLFNFSGWNSAGKEFSNSVMVVMIAHQHDVMIPPTNQPTNHKFPFGELLLSDKKPDNAMKCDANVNHIDFFEKDSPQKLSNVT